MEVFSIACPPLDNRCYVLWQEGAAKPRPAIVVDPSMAFERVMELAAENSLEIELIVNTHGHPDHMFNNFELKQATGAQLCIHELDEYRLEKNLGETRPWLPRPPMLQKADFSFKEGAVLEAGGIKLKLLHTPGHTEGSSCFLLEEADESGRKILFTGDTLFKGTYGRTDFPGGNEEQMFQTLKRLYKLDDGLRVLPGHSQETVLGEEKSWMKKFVEEV